MALPPMRHPKATTAWSLAAVAIALLGCASQAAAAPCASCGPSRITSATVFYDTAGVHKGALHVRVLATHDGAAAVVPTHGHVLLTVSGPGGEVTLRDRLPIAGVNAGHMSDHRMRIAPGVARRVLGPEGRRARLRTTVRAAAGTPPGAGARENAPKGWHTPLVPAHPATTAPPSPMRWVGESGSLSVIWTNRFPFMPYVASIIPRSGAAPWLISPQDPNSNVVPAENGAVQADGSFVLAVAQPGCGGSGMAQANGRVPALINGWIPAFGAEVMWWWQDAGWPCGSGQGGGPLAAT